MAVAQRIRLSSRSIGLLLRFFAVAMLIGAMVGWAVPAAHAEPAGGGAKRFGACLASQKAGDLLLLFDESSSLQSTDPQAARVQAARYLLQTLGKYADRVGANLEVASAGFSDAFAPEHNWTKLTGSSCRSAGFRAVEHRHKEHWYRHRLLAGPRRCASGVGVTRDQGPTAGNAARRSHGSPTAKSISPRGRRPSRMPTG